MIVSPSKNKQSLARCHPTLRRDVSSPVRITIPISRVGDKLAKCDLCHIVIKTEKRDTAMQHIIEGFLNF
ncbi:MAG: hypothetical protein E7I52_15930, partial [Klebsiella michiganensis]|nr:hypothetical protein [Klebsiella michiganensis]